MVRRIDGITSTQVLPSQDQCEKARLAEILSRRGRWQPEISMTSDGVRVRRMPPLFKSPDRAS